MIELHNRFHWSVLLLQLYNIDIYENFSLKQVFGPTLFLSFFLVLDDRGSWPVSRDCGGDRRSERAERESSGNRTEQKGMKLWSNKYRRLIKRHRLRCSFLVNLNFSSVPLQIRPPSSSFSIASPWRVPRLFDADWCRGTSSAPRRDITLRATCGQTNRVWPRMHRMTVPYLSSYLP